MLLMNFFYHLTHINILDFLGSLFAFIATIYYVRANALAWFASLFAIFVNVFLYWQKGIYGDTGLQFVYLAMTIYGWWQWHYGNTKYSKGGGQHSSLPITHIKLNAVLVLLVITLAGIIGGSLFLLFYTNSRVPYWDATTTVMSLLGQWLMCRKIIETWIVWFVVDVLFAGLYIYKGIPVHATLQLVYLGMAIAGYINWKRKLMQSNSFPST